MDEWVGGADPGWSLAALLRAARSSLGGAVRSALEGAGFDDLPANGPYVLGAISRTGMPLADITRHLGLSKQASGQLVDLLVLRGYLDRSVDPDDRRRLLVSLTARGAAAAIVVREAVDGAEAALAAAVGADVVQHARRALAALATIGVSDA